jgi:hypothetical protein|tara:strand:+ start:2867 stop:4009 length:1143 start_codon:yes stop_codon:yes gene_type:complete
VSFFYDKAESSLTGLDPIEYGGEEPGFIDAFEAGFQTRTRAKNSDAKLVLLDELMSPVIDTVMDRGGPEFVNPSHYYGASDSLGHSEKMTTYATEKIISYIKENPETFPEYQDLSLEKINADILGTARAELEEGERVAAKARGLASFGNILGDIAGYPVDRNFIEGTLLLGPTLGASTSIWRQSLRAAVIEGGIEATLQPAVKEWYDELGLDYDYSDFVTNVASAGVGAGAMPIAFRGVAMTIGQARKGIRAFKDSDQINKKDADILEASLDEQEILMDRPEGITDPIEHEANLDDATMDIIDGRMPGTKGPTLDDPLPTIPEIEELPTDALDRALDDLADDEVLVTGPGDEDFLTGADIKRVIQEDEAILDRLRGCVIR